MTNIASRAAAPRRRLWPLFAIVAFVIVLAVAWTGLWFYAAARAKAEVADWRNRERQAGRLQDCASLSIGGFPFRIEVRCEGGSFEIEGSPPLKLELPFALAMVQVYDPKLLISEFTGPARISESGRAPLYVVNWNLGRASVRGLPSELDRFSLEYDGFSLRDGSAGDPILRAQHLELHGRRTSGSRADYASIETVLRLNGAIAEKIHPALARPTDANVAGVLRGVDDLSPKPWRLRFSEWQARDGEVEITKARIQQEDIIAVGAVKLTPRGGLDGKLQVTVVGIEKILKLFDLERVMSEGQVGAALNVLDRLIPGLGGIARQSGPSNLVAALGQRTVLEGKQAVALPVRFADGAVFLGPFQVGTVPPLF
jgi:hypothetical protein